MCYHAAEAGVALQEGRRALGRLEESIIIRETLITEESE
jgi:hypothetical protein